MVLPFAEKRALSASMLKHCIETKFPAWDRDSTGNPLVVKVDDEFRPMLGAWAKENATGMYGVKNRTAYFEKEKDFILARVMFGCS